MSSRGLGNRGITVAIKLGPAARALTPSIEAWIGSFANNSRSVLVGEVEVLTFSCETTENAFLVGWQLTTGWNANSDLQN